MISPACHEPLPKNVRRGLEEFNAGQYFEQHETLERVWRAEMRPVRDLYRGILQIGLALYQIERGNVRGALKMFERAFRWLEPFRPACQGVDVDRLLAESRAVYEEVRRLGAERIVEFDRSKFPQVHLIGHPDTKA
jgi:predicted metal-dependent hydrolase